MNNEEKLVEARRLIAEVNESEKDNPELSWRPWVIRRSGMRV